MLGFSPVSTAPVCGVGGGNVPPPESNTHEATGGFRLNRATDGPINYWPLDEYGLEHFQDVVGGADAYGLNLGWGSAAPTSFDNSYALELAGNGGAELFPSFDWLTDSFSFACWFKTSGSGGILCQTNQTFLGGNPTGPIPALYIDSTGHLRASMFWQGSSLYQDISDTIVWDGSWHHVAVTWNASAGTQSLYVDGALESQTTGRTQNAYDSVYRYWLGAVTGSGWPDLDSNWSYLSGSLDDVRFYKRTLGGADVSFLAAGGGSYYRGSSALVTVSSGFEAVGAMSLSGAAALAGTVATASAGGATLTGVALAAVSAAFGTIGGLSVSGMFLASVVVDNTASADGGFAFSGTATERVTVAQGGDGSCGMSGNAESACSGLYDATGPATFDGVAVAQQGGLYSAGGPLGLSGYSALRVVVAYDTAGSIGFSGINDRDGQTDLICEMDGGISASGRVLLGATYETAAGLRRSLGGSADCEFDITDEFGHVGDGGLSISDRAVVRLAYFHAATAAGGLALSFGRLVGTSMFHPSDGGLGVGGTARSLGVWDYQVAALGRLARVRGSASASARVTFATHIATGLLALYGVHGPQSRDAVDGGGRLGRWGLNGVADFGTGGLAASIATTQPAFAADSSIPTDVFLAMLAPGTPLRTSLERIDGSWTVESFDTRTRIVVLRLPWGRASVRVPQPIKDDLGGVLYGSNVPLPPESNIFAAAGATEEPAALPAPQPLVGRPTRRPTTRSGRTQVLALFPAATRTGRTLRAVPASDWGDVTIDQAGGVVRAFLSGRLVELAIPR